MDKPAAYAALVTSRKQCRACEQAMPVGAGLVNPAHYLDGVHDCDHIGAWSRWQGNLDAEVLVVGQDWGDVGFFERHKGADSVSTPTDGMLVKLLGAVDVTISLERNDGANGSIFLTNAILCLKRGGMAARVRSDWFDTCGPRYLKPLIEIVQPRIVVTLGAWAYQSVCHLWSLKQLPLRDAVDDPQGFHLSSQTVLFPRYHCGRRILNTVRKLEQQHADWERIGTALEQLRGKEGAPSQTICLLG